jgi:hypothetical protein
MRPIGTLVAVRGDRHRRGDAAAVAAGSVGVRDPAPRPGAPAVPALLPSIVRTSVRLPFGKPCDMTILGSTAWFSDWSASQIVGVDLTARQVEILRLSRAVGGASLRAGVREHGRHPSGPAVWPGLACPGPSR